MQAVSRDLRIVSSDRSFQIACTAALGSATLCRGLGFSLLKLTKIIYYCSFLHVNNNHNDVLTKVIVAARVSLTRNSSGDVIANVNFLRRHRTRTTAHNKVHFAYGKTHVYSCQMRLLQL